MGTSPWMAVAVRSTSKAMKAISNHVVHDMRTDDKKKANPWSQLDKKSYISLNAVWEFDEVFFQDSEIEAFRLFVKLLDILDSSYMLIGISTLPVASDSSSFDYKNMIIQGVFFIDPSVLLGSSLYSIPSTLDMRWMDASWSLTSWHWDIMSPRTTSFNI